MSAPTMTFQAILDGLLDASGLKDVMAAERAAGHEFYLNATFESFAIATRRDRRHKLVHLPRTLRSVWRHVEPGAPATFLRVTARTYCGVGIKFARPVVFIRDEKWCTQCGINARRELGTVPAIEVAW